MGIAVLGPVVVDGSGPVSPRDRVLLSVLVVRRNAVVAPDQLADVLWGDEPPDSWRKVVQGGITRLRKVLGSSAIETTSDGYRLVAGDEDVDAWRFEQLVGRATLLAESGEPDRATDLLRRALALWRGEPLADVGSWTAGQAEAARLFELRRLAEETQVAARLALGEHRDVVATAAALASEEPLREERWALLATALYRAGRQGEALRCLNDARRVLADQLGITPGADLVALEQAILDQDPALDAPIPVLGGARAECPYRGLEAYDEQQASGFFGREADTAECRRRLATNRFLAVVGPSGSGKSSLARAGIVAALRAEGRTARVCVPGGDPPGALATALAAAGPDAVLVVDQAEELFTVCTDASRRERFAVALTEQADRRPVVLAMRADHIGDLVPFPALTRLVERGLYLLGPMGESDLRAAIEGPARDAGLRLEAGLVDLLVRDVLGQPGALPLLSHALVETWSRREGRVLTVAAYRESGGVHGAVARTAEQLYDSLSEPQRHDTRALFLRLVSVERDGQAVRHRLPRSMLGSEQDEIAGTLVRARLLTAGADGSLEVAHEALARAWPRLRHWLEEDRDGQRVLTHLAGAAQDWETRGQDAEDLYRGARLDGAHEWVQRTDFDLSPVEQQFLAASDAARTAELDDLEARHRAQATTNRRLNRRLRAVAVLLVIALVATALAVVQVQKADDERNRARVASERSTLQNVISQSLGFRGTKRDLGALLAAETYRLRPGPATENALFSTFTGAPDFAGYLRADEPFSTGSLDDGGHRLAVADERATVRVYDLDHMRLLRRIRPTRRSQYGVVDMSGDATTVVVAAGTGRDGFEGGVLSAYDTRSGRSRFGNVELDFPPGDLAISPDARFVAASGGPEGRIEVHDLRDGALTARIDPAPAADGPNDLATAAVAFMTADRLVVGSESGLIRIVAPATGEVLQSIAAPPGMVETKLSVSPDGTTLVTDGAFGTTVIDVARGAERWPASRRATCSRIAADFAHGVLLCSDSYGHVSSIDLGTGVEEPQAFEFQAGFVSDIELSGDGQTLALVGGEEGTVGLWRRDGSGPLHRRVGQDADSALSYNPAGGAALLVADWGAVPPTFRVVAPRSGRDLGNIDALNATWTTRRNDNRVAAIFSDGRSGVYDLKQRRRVGASFTLPFVPSLGVTDAARDRLVLLDDRGHVRGYRNSGPVAPHLDLPGGVRSPNGGGITPDGRYLLVASEQQGTEVFSLATGRRVAADLDLVNVAVGPHGLAAAGGRDGHVALYDASTLRRRKTLPSAPGSAAALRFSADGRRLLVQAWDGTVRLVDVDSRTAIGDPIPIARREGSIVSSQQLLRSDGRELAVDLDEGIAVWDLSPRAWMDAACTVAGRNLTRAEWRQYLADLGDYHRTCDAPID